MTKEKKNFLRKFLIQNRESISSERRKEAEDKALEFLYHHLKDFKNILSYSSFNHEFPTWTLNEKLAGDKRLLLPLIDKDSLKIFQIKQ